VLQRLAESLVFNEAPRVVKALQHTPAVQQGIRLGLEALGVPEKPDTVSAGRPVTSGSAPTAQRARRLVYAPTLNGRANPGEVVWAWVVYDDDPNRGRDHPVLIVGRERQTLLGLMLSSRNQTPGQRHWVGIGTVPWDDDGDPGWVRLDRVFDVPEEGIRRQGAILDHSAFNAVAERLRTDYCWR
jgi:hypothetical protein